MNYAAIVPVYNPESGLLPLCESLLRDFALLLVVDDGSNENTEQFAKLPKGTRLIRHTVNRGKGRAMKTALEWVLQNAPEMDGAVFADGDGQHRPEDVVATAERAQKADRVTLGTRDFSASNIPFRSRFGNVLTSFLVRLMFRIPIYDTQTGLRAIPRRLFPKMVKLTGERYEYEMRLFDLLRNLNEKLEQVPIKTIYIENNRASHFMPVRDSIRVYRGLFGDAFVKFCCSSFLGFLVDNTIFSLIIFVISPIGLLRRYEILIGLVIARISSSVVNYLVNARFVFRETARFEVESSSRYFVLAISIAVMSYVGTVFFSAFLDANGIFITVVKIVFESVLFIVSYRLQKLWVFRRGRND